jgi:hypothetical protein
VIQSEAFWNFMLERENIRIRRLSGLSREEWTADPIFKKFSFTNVKRIHDRTTTLLFNEFYNVREMSHRSPQALLNAVLFRYFGTIEMARAIGWHPEWNEDFKKELIAKSAARMSVGQTVFTSAYIVPNCGSPLPKHQIVAEVVDSIWNDATNILDTDRWEIACERLCTHWGVGSFMAKEVLLDYILATGWVPTDWTTWTPVGPGGRRGAGVVKYNVIKGISEWEALSVIRQLYHDRAAFWPDDYVQLDLTDIQFQLCEFAKYMKAVTGVGAPKRRFRPTIDSVTSGEI